MDNLITFLNTTGKSFVDFATPMLIQSSVLIVVLLILDFILRKKVRAVFRYCIWMLVLVKLVLPTTLSSPTGLGYWFGDKLSAIVSEKPLVTERAVTIAPAIEPISQTLPPETGGVALPSPNVTHEPVAAIPAEPAIAASSATVSLSWQGFAFLGWLAAVTAMSLLLVQRMFFVRGLLAQSKNPDDSMVDIFEQCRKQMGLRRPMFLKLSPVAASPSVCGLFRPTILIPQNLPDKLKAEDLSSILLHELAHIKRGDLPVSLVQTILQIAYFYNPLLWVANAIIRNVREQAVDEMVLVAMGARADNYPETLLNISRLTFSRPALSLRLIGVVESKKALTSRIKHILSRPFPKTAKLGFVGLITIIVAAAILLPMAKAVKGITAVPYKGYQAVYDFDGVNDYLEVPDNKELDIGNAFTAELWIKVHEATGEDAIFSKEVPWKSGWTLIIVPKGGVREREAVSDSRIDAKLYSLTFAVGDGNRFYNLTSLPCLEKDKWHHVAATWFKGKGSIYVDEHLVCSQEFPVAAPARVPLRIGKGSANLGRHFNGELADIRLWNTVRRIKDINKKKNRRLSGKESDLAACWVSPPNSDGIVRDMSPNGNDGRIIDSISVSKLNLKSDVQIEGKANQEQIEIEKATSEKSTGIQKRYEHISFKKGMSIREALQFLAKAYKKNIIPSDKIKGQVPVTDLYDVTLEEVLKAILGTQKFVIEDDFIRVYTAQEFDSLYPFGKSEAESENKALLTSFGSVIELEIAMCEGGFSSSACLIDFETGRLYSLPERFKAMQNDTKVHVEQLVYQWCVKNGIDTAAYREGGQPGFVLELGEDLGVFVDVDNGMWGSSSEEVLGVLGGVEERDWEREIKADEIPDVFGLETAEGNFGLVRILDYDKEKMKIRYKLVKPLASRKGEGGKVEVKGNKYNLMARSSKGRMEALDPEAANLINRYLHALEKSDWKTALSVCSKNIINKAQQYPTAESFFNDVVPVKEIFNQLHDPRMGWWQLPPKYFAYIFDVRISQPDLPRDVFWVWQARKPEGQANWEIDFPALTFETWLGNEKQEIIHVVQEKEQLIEKLAPKLKGVKTLLTTKKKEFAIEEPIYFCLQLINQGDSILSYDSQQVTVNNSMTIEGPGGEKVKYTAGPFQTMGGPVLIKPGETQTLFDQFDITKQYDIRQPGEYRVQFNGNSLPICVAKEVAPDFNDISKSFEYYPGLLPGNIVTITIHSGIRQETLDVGKDGVEGEKAVSQTNTEDKPNEQVEGKMACIEGLCCNAELIENKLKFGQGPELTVSLTNTTTESIDVIGYCRDSKMHSDRYPLPCAQLKVSPVGSKHYRITSNDYAVAIPEAIRITPGKSWSFSFPPPKMKDSAKTKDDTSSLPSLSAWLPGRYTAQVTYFIRESEIEKFEEGLVFGSEMGSLAGKKPDRLWQGVLHSKELIFEVLDDDSEELRIRKAVDSGEGLENVEFELRASKTKVYAGQKVTLSFSVKNMGTKTQYLGNSYGLHETGPRGKRANYDGPRSTRPTELEPGANIELRTWGNLGWKDEPVPGTYTVWVEYHSELSPEKVLKKSNTVTIEVLKPDMQVEGTTRFGPVVKRILGLGCAWINLESGTTPDSPSKEMSSNAQHQWCRESGIDAVGRMATGRLDFLDVKMVKLNDHAWTRLSVDGLLRALKDDELIRISNIDGLAAVALDGRSEKGITYGFRTREGTLGLLKIEDFWSLEMGPRKDNPNLPAFITILYKLALSPEMAQTVILKRPLSLGEQQYLDLDSGEYVFMPGENVNPEHLKNQGVDIYLIFEKPTASAPPIPMLNVLGMATSRAPHKLYLQQVPANSDFLSIAIAHLNKPQRLKNYGAHSIHFFRTAQGKAGAMKIKWLSDEPPKRVLQYKFLPELDIPIEKFPWVLAVEGMQSRLRARKTTWKADETPTLSLDLRNLSEKTIGFVRIVQAHCEIEIDGHWYGWAEPLVIHAHVWMLEPGTELNDAIEIKLTDSWALPKKSEQLKRMPGVSEFWGSRLKLTPGKHNVRVKFRPEEWMEGYLKGDKDLSIVSNPIEIEILPEEKPAVQVKATVYEAAGTATTTREELRAQALQDAGARHLRFDDQGNITELYFGREATDEKLVLLKGLQSLRRLYLGGAEITDEGLESLQGLTSLEYLNLYQTRITDEALAHLKGLANLRELRLHGNSITDAGLVHIEGLTSLEVLTLNRTLWVDDNMHISDVGMQFLRGLKNLRTIDLKRTDVTAAGLEYLTALPELENIYLGGPNIDDAAMQILGKMNQLRSLEIRGTEVTDAGMQHIRNLTNLELFNLSTRLVTNAGLANVTGLKRLRSLQLSSPHFSDATLEHLITLPHLEQLCLTDMAGGTAYTAAALALLKDVGTLRSLDLYGWHISEAELVAFSKMKNLERLWISTHNIKLPGDDFREKVMTVRSRLSRALPHTRIILGPYDFWLPPVLPNENNNEPNSAPVVSNPVEIETLSLEKPAGQVEGGEGKPEATEDASNLKIIKFTGVVTNIVKFNPDGNHDTFAVEDDARFILFLQVTAADPPNFHFRHGSAVNFLIHDPVILFGGEQEQVTGRSYHFVVMEEPKWSTGEAKRRFTLLSVKPKSAQQKLPVQVEGETEGQKAQQTKKVFLPDVDKKGVMLDLASGRLVDIFEPATGLSLLETIDKLDKGDVIFDARALVFVRGASSNNSILHPEFALFKMYKIGDSLPEELIVTTKEGARYNLKILTIDDNGINFEYQPLAVQVEGE